MDAHSPYTDAFGRHGKLFEPRPRMSTSSDKGRHDLLPFDPHFTLDDERDLLDDIRQDPPYLSEDLEETLSALPSIPDIPSSPSIAPLSYGLAAPVEKAVDLAESTNDESLFDDSPMFPLFEDMMASSSTIDASGQDDSRVQDVHLVPLEAENGDSKNKSRLTAIDEQRRDTSTATPRDTTDRPSTPAEDVSSMPAMTRPDLASLLRRLGMTENEVGHCEIARLRRAMQRANFSKTQQLLIKDLRKKVRNRGSANKYGKRVRGELARLQSEVVPQLQQENASLREKLTNLGELYDGALRMVQDLTMENEQLRQINVVRPA